MEYFLLGELNCDMAALVHDNHTRHLTNITDVYGLTNILQIYPHTPQGQ